MTNTTKWVIAIPFVLIVAVLIPTWITRDPVWFRTDWGEICYVVLTAGMWLAATGFVDLDRPRSKPDLANYLIPTGLILSVPLSVYDRSSGFARQMPDGLVLLAVVVSILAISLGVSARKTLGQAYSPRSGTQEQVHLVQLGPYRWIRHPMYAAAMLWCIGWPLFLRSILGALITLAFIVPGIMTRISAEERELTRVLGEEYRNYVRATWRLVPFIY